MTQDFSTRAIKQAEQMIADGEFSLALDRLKTAAKGVRWWSNRDSAAALAARIQELADAVASDDPSYVPQAQAIRGILEGREVPDAVGEGEPWFYRAADLIADCAFLASAASLILGIAAGAAAGAYTGSDGHTHYRGGYVAAGIVSGALAAVGWFAAGVALNLLVDIGRTARASSRQS